MDSSVNDTVICLKLPDHLLTEFAVRLQTFLAKWTFLQYTKQPAPSRDRTFPGTLFNGLSTVSQDIAVFEHDGTICIYNSMAVVTKYNY